MVPQTRPRLSPEAVVEVALSKVAKLEKALEVLGDTEGPVYEALQAELKRRQVCSSVATSQCSVGTVSVIHREGQKTNLRFGSREGAPRGGVGRRPRCVWFDWRPRVATPLPLASTVPDLDAQVVSLRATIARKNEMQHWQERW